MLRPQWAADWAQRARFVIFLVFLAACFLWGGASRLDVPGLAIVQPAAVLCIAAIFLVPGKIDLTAVRTPLLLLAALAIVMMVQLVPLPPAMWEKLPGHAPFADVARVAGAQRLWRPISLTPDLTLASLVALVVPLAALLGFASLSKERRFRLLPYLLAAVGLSALLGLAQIVGGPQSGFYRYETTNLGSAVGFFSNRNHQAVLLAMGFPMLALWATMAMRDARRAPVRPWVATAAAIFLLPMLAVTGSRAGLLLGAVGMGFAWWQLRQRRQRSEQPERRTRFSSLVRIAPVLGGVGVLGAAFALSRAEALDRLFGSNVLNDPRAQSSSVVVEMTRDFFPVGSGFGSFDPIFRVYEPLGLLSPLYFNHAHNDLVEIAITGGIAGLLLVVLFLVWVVPVAVRAVRAADRSRSDGFAKLACAMIVIVLASSLVDYPLRTPLLSAIFAIACGWLASRNADTQSLSGRSH
ncbi:O-antigen ligase family protein [Sphingosinicella sp. LY1275]|uniref:O-antigen ligase family protein n=1 Tax=Sphingosinicella sp. LY1275 TaxID=3095379 RepID=UPI002ADEF0A8|nr:O-antigen ligase family protein [Sphingosinicella sp. LY1275]MEA1014469.1 O-antigen ligase family protein [Sphingosinicella sp. LY1275]